MNNRYNILSNMQSRIIKDLEENLGTYLSYKVRKDNNIKNSFDEIDELNIMINNNNRHKVFKYYKEKFLNILSYKYKDDVISEICNHILKTDNMKGKYNIIHNKEDLDNNVLDFYNDLLDNKKLMYITDKLKLNDYDYDIRKENLKKFNQEDVLTIYVEYLTFLDKNKKLDITKFI